MTPGSAVLSLGTISDPSQEKTVKYTSRSRTRGLVTIVACLGSVVIGVALGASEMPRDMTRAGGRIIAVPGPTIRSALWEERRSEGSGPSVCGISLDGRSFVRIIPVSFILGFRHAQFDPLVGVPAIEQFLSADGESRLHIVQFVGQPREVHAHEITAPEGEVRAHEVVQDGHAGMPELEADHDLVASCVDRVGLSRVGFPHRADRQSKLESSSQSRVGVGIHIRVPRVDVTRARACAISRVACSRRSSTALLRPAITASSGQVQISKSTQSLQAPTSCGSPGVTVGRRASSWWRPEGGDALRTRGGDGLRAEGDDGSPVSELPRRYDLSA